MQGIQLPPSDTVDLGVPADMEVADGDRAHLHWDRQNRRWVTHEEAMTARLTQDRQSGRGQETSRIR